MNFDEAYSGSINDRETSSMAFQPAFFDQKPSTYIPYRSPATHINIASDSKKSKFTDEVFHDMEDRNAYFSELPAYHQSEFVQRSQVLPPF